ncbi:hypothetical protein JAAARDRAFT_210946 [Jaapia argillacea MUCL 33604]|uniref:Uncharacterized protein n=1 Tax=Jaapia argillacea MUCL 33604 TaxID=933084 RepID=A0A067PCR9_9AGAM|nr:hypothetical protein JAAARDRAFT_210946 [Jaapia argillacea MUCL 33604]
MALSLQNTSNMVGKKASMGGFRYPSPPYPPTPRFGTPAHEFKQSRLRRWIDDLHLAEDITLEGVESLERSNDNETTASRESGGWMQLLEVPPPSTSVPIATTGNGPTSVDPFIRHPKPQKAHAPQWVNQCEFLEVYCDEVRRPPTLGLESPMPYSWPRSEITLVGRTRSRNAKLNGRKGIESDQDNVDWMVWPYMSAASGCDTYESYVSLALGPVSKITPVRSGDELRGRSQRTVPATRSPPNHPDDPRFTDPILHEDGMNMVAAERNTQASDLHNGWGWKDEGSPRRVAGMRIRQQLALLELLVTEIPSWGFDTSMFAQQQSGLW